MIEETCEIWLPRVICHSYSYKYDYTYMINLKEIENILVKVRGNNLYLTWFNLVLSHYATPSPDSYSSLSSLRELERVHVEDMLFWL